VAHTIVLALAAAVYPTILAGVIVLLRQKNPRPLLLGFWLGGMTISIVAGLVVLEAIKESGKAVDTSSTARPALDIVLGLLTLVFAFAIWTGRTGRLEAWRARRTAKKPPPDPDKKSFTDRWLGRGSIWLAVGAGVILNLPGVWYLAALADIATDSPFSYQLSQIVVFNLIMFTLVEVPLAIYLIDEQRAQRTVDSFDAWVRSHKREVGGGVATAVGIFLVAKGIIAAT
jgi:uncharacterized membrane protein YfcA